MSGYNAAEALADLMHLHRVDSLDAMYSAAVQVAQAGGILNVLEVYQEAKEFQVNTMTNELGDEVYDGPCA